MTMAAVIGAAAIVCTRTTYDDTSTDSASAVGSCHAVCPRR